MLTVGVRLSNNRLSGYASEIKARVDQVQRKTCADIVAGAIARTMRVMTGAMKSGYRFERVGELEYIVYNLLHYHIYHELGTVSIAAMPMLVPALEAVRVAYSTAISRALSSGPR